MLIVPNNRGPDLADRHAHTRIWDIHAHRGKALAVTPGVMLPEPEGILNTHKLPVPVEHSVAEGHSGGEQDLGRHKHNAKQKCFISAPWLEHPHNPWRILAAGPTSPGLTPHPAPQAQLWEEAAASQGGMLPRVGQGLFMLQLGREPGRASRSENYSEHN